ncbi:MAG: hypothetical protein J5687_02390 [Treponema sp.]|nr:hypothetical protein [Treponema sp.]
MTPIEKEYLSENTLRQNLAKRIGELECLLLDKSKALKTAPEGTLRIAKSNGTVQYYHRTNTKDKTGKYILSKNRQLAKSLAQKEYDQCVMAYAQSELKLLKHTFKSYDKMYSKKHLAEAIFGKLNPFRRALIKPVRLPDEMYAQKWQATPYKTKSFTQDTPEYVTARGDRVRSKSENIIADTLFRLKIPYRYECPLILKNTSGEKITLHPDFTCLDVRTRHEFYWEHFGMMDKPDYAERAVQRLRLYERNNIFPGKNLIITNETAAQPINTRQIERLVKAIFNIA